MDKPSGLAPARQPGAERPKVWIEPVLCPQGGAAQAFDMSDEIHRQYLFIHSVGGDAELDGWQTPLRPGEVAFIPAHAHAHITLNGGTRAMRIGIADDFLMSRVLPALGVSPAPYWGDFHSPKKLGHWTSQSEAKERDRLWEELQRAASRLGTSGDAAVAAYVLMTLFEKNNIALTALDAAELPVANAASEMPQSTLDLVARFRGLVERELASDWQISDYCRELGVRPVQLSQACKELLDRTPISIVHEQKLLHAKRQLTYSRSSAAEIAYQLGFNDPAYFSRFFRRYTGKSPVEFRRMPSTLEVDDARVSAVSGGFGVQPRTN
ncbi:MAG: hypothetical protein JWR77_394 [Rhizorhabdus sp.]|nr:hypothetical protein [Rhizorhabdus sp.]